VFGVYLLLGFEEDKLMSTDKLLHTGDQLGVPQKMFYLYF
jgi:hypothetical protein